MKKQGLQKVDRSTALYIGFAIMEFTKNIQHNMKSIYGCLKAMFSHIKYGDMMLHYSALLYSAYKIQTQNVFFIPITSLLYHGCKSRHLCWLSYFRMKLILIPKQQENC